MSEDNSSEKKSNLNERSKAFVASVSDKTDELYNKLPLDKINEKFKGKVNVKGKKFKIVLLALVCCLLLLLLKVCVFSSGSSQIIIPDYNYTWEPNFVKFFSKLVDAGFYCQYMATINTLKENKVSLCNTYKGQDARTVCTEKFIREKHGDKVAEKFKEKLKSEQSGDWKTVSEEMDMAFQNKSRIATFILDNIVDAANKELARRANPNTIKSVKKLFEDMSTDFHGVGDTYQDNWEGEFIVLDEQQREFDKVFFACNVSWDKNKNSFKYKAKKRSYAQLPGDAPLKFDLVWFGTSFPNGNWMSSGY